MKPKSNGICKQCKKKAKAVSNPVGAWWNCPRCFRQFGCTAQAGRKGT